MIQTYILPIKKVSTLTGSAAFLVLECLHNGIVKKSIVKEHTKF